MAWLATLFVINSFVLLTLSSGHGEAKWAYNSHGGLEEPSSWNHISKYCDSTNFRQSPININTQNTLQTNEHRVCAPKMELDWNVIGFKRKLLAKNNGHSLSLTPIKNENDKLDKSSNTIAELINWWNVRSNII
eukprot:328893_1